MAIRIHDIAKELGIDNKAILAKCKAEGIPESQVKNHMSTVSAGLAATIREWFSSAGPSSAVETSDRVDLDKVRLKPKRARSGKSGDDADPPGPVEPVSETGTAVAEPPSRPARRPAAPADDAPADDPRREPPAEPATPRLTDEPIEPIEPKARAAASHAPAPPPAIARPAAVIAPPPPPPPPPAVIQPAPQQPVATAAVEPPKATVRPPPPAPVTVTPAPMNVPLRPKVVQPAGPKLQVQTPVKLSGPKVVRVEAPEVLPTPRARRPAAGDGPAIPLSRGPRGGTGVTGAGAGAGEDDHGRSPRRGAGNTRRAPVAPNVPDRRKGRSGPDSFGTGAGIYSEQDLIEREARLLRAGGFLKQRRQQLKKQDQPTGERASSAAETGGRVAIAGPFTIKDLSAATGVKAAEIVKKLFLQGIHATINSGIDPAKAQEIMIEYDIELEVVAAKSAEEAVSAEFGERQAVDLRPRGPVVTILGHVDHGKTSLLDKIRNANVAAGEAGGITQKTSAFRVPVRIGQDEKFVVFFDTPGHQAFTSMRSRGAQITDIVVLVVSAPEGVMPQTIESINHAKAAKVPIVVALNKVDRADATDAVIQKTLRQLADAGLNPVEWGGDTEIVKTSATTGAGIPELLETLDYQSQLLDLKADFGGEARGTVIEARVVEGRGTVANLLVQQGSLKVGDFVVVGRGFGRVRDITDDRGQKVKEAVPPMPVQISGIDEIPDAGDRFYVVDSLRKAQESAEQRRARERETQLAQPKVTLDSLFTQMADKSVKEILVVLKADLQGTVDVLKSEIEKVGTSEVKVRVLHGAAGGISESDVLLADASRAIVIGFNVIASAKARQFAEIKGIEIRTYDVIYDVTDDIRKAAEGLLAPEIRQEALGHAEVRAVFKITKVGSVAGCYVTDGIVQRDALIRVTRAGIVVEKDRRLEQLKRLKDDAKDVRAGMECGMKIVGYDDIKEGDVLECYRIVETRRTLDGGRAEPEKAGAGRGR
ncbi:MAG: translation initiation factor IF-2 [Phycisphaerales bacterium]